MRIFHAITQKASALWHAFVTMLICLLLMSVIWQGMTLSLLFLPVPWGIVTALVILILACVLMIWIADKRHPVLMAAKGAHQCQ